MARPRRACRGCATPHFARSLKWARLSFVPPANSSDILVLQTDGRQSDINKQAARTTVHADKTMHGEDGRKTLSAAWLAPRPDVSFQLGHRQPVRRHPVPNPVSATRDRGPGN